MIFERFFYFLRLAFGHGHPQSLEYLRIFFMASVLSWQLGPTLVPEFVISFHLIPFPCLVAIFPVTQNIWVQVSSFCKQYLCFIRYLISCFSLIWSIKHYPPWLNQRKGHMQHSAVGDWNIKYCSADPRSMLITKFGLRTTHPPQTFRPLPGFLGRWILVCTSVWIVWRRICPKKSDNLHRLRANGKKRACTL